MKIGLATDAPLMEGALELDELVLGVLALESAELSLLAPRIAALLLPPRPATVVPERGVVAASSVGRCSFALPVASMVPTRESSLATAANSCCSTALNAGDSSPRRRPVASSAAAAAGWLTPATTASVVPAGTAGGVGCSMGRAAGDVPDRDAARVTTPGDLPTGVVLFSLPPFSLLVRAARS
jgi:hypothetical protein